MATPSRLAKSSDGNSFRKVAGFVFEAFNPNFFGRFRSIQKFSIHVRLSWGGINRTTADGACHTPKIGQGMRIKPIKSRISARIKKTVRLQKKAQLESDPLDLGVNSRRFGDFFLNRLTLGDSQTQRYELT